MNDGTQIDQAWYSITSGTGTRPVIWLHGWGQDHRAFDRLRPLFDAEYKNTAYDQPGFGNTNAPPSGSGTADYADMLASILKKNGDGSCVFVGHSFGGRVSVRLAAKYPELVSAIILIAGAGIPRSRSFFYRLRALALKILGRGAKLGDAVFKTSFHKRYSERFGSADYRNAGELRPTFVKVVNENLTATAGRIKAPTLLIYGSDDTEAPSEIGRKYEAAIPIARFEELDGFDHYDILTRGAYQCEALIKGFLKDVEKS